MACRHATAQQGSYEVNLRADDLASLFATAHHCFDRIIGAMLDCVLGEAGLNAHQALRFLIAKRGFAFHNFRRDVYGNFGPIPFQKETHFLAARDHNGGLQFNKVIDPTAIDGHNLIAGLHASGRCGTVGQHL